MTGGVAQRLTPDSAEEAAALLRDAAGSVRIRGGATKLGWGRPVAADVELGTDRLDAVVAHNEGDLTAVLGAGCSLARAQEVFAAAGQMLALDPPGEGATIGGVVASGDGGPLRHRYGAPRDLVLGVQLALPDGTVARAGSKVIKNVAGYDLAKLCSGAFGTLGLLTEVTVRLHPLPAGWCTAIGRCDDPRVLADAASALTHLPLEAEALDLWWEHGAGAVLARFGGPTAADRAEGALRTLGEAGLEGACVPDDAPLWAMQRAAQRGAVVLRVSTTQDRLGLLLAWARDHGARVVARAAHAVAWVTLAGGDARASAVPDGVVASEASVVPDGVVAASEAAAVPDGVVAASEAAAVPDGVVASEASAVPDGVVASEASAVPDDEALAAAVRELRGALSPSPCVLLDAPAGLRQAVDPWAIDAGQLELMRRVKERFDPQRRCNPGLFAEAI